MKNALYELCKPRPSTFEGSRSDLVLDLNDLHTEKISAESFFSENFLTSGMKELFQKALRRLAGEDPNPVFILKQNMGGGKTHSMIALGLLARSPQLIERIAPGVLPSKQLIKPVVLSFSGRSSVAASIWGTFAKQTNIKGAFSEESRTLEAPGQAEWESFFNELGPTLVLLDELPPFLESAASRTVGNSNHAKTAITGLSNMFVAANRCKNVCIVLSDVGAIYEDGAKAMNDALQIALKQLQGEAGRLAVPIEPVKLDSDEIYNILRTRLFESIPDKKVITAVAEGFGKALEKAKEFHSGFTEKGNTLALAIQSSYPFHPSIKDLYARFRENPGFYQTRGLIRLMRLVIANLFDAQNGAAKHVELICAHHIDLGDRQISSEINSINASLANAMSRDVADNGRSHAETIAAETESSEAIDIARLLLIASLSNVPNGVHGLSESEIVKFLASPTVDFSKLAAALDQLRSHCWYLHESPQNKRIAFRNVENINAKLRHLAQGCSKEISRKRISAILKEMYEPTEKHCYQNIAVFPALDELRSQIRPSAVTIVIAEPHAEGLNPDLVRFFNETDFKNRVMFLTGQGNELTGLHERAARENAAKTIKDEMDSQKIPSNDPQYEDIKRILEDSSKRLRDALQDIFCDLYYPTKDSQLSKTEFKIELENNRFIGEQQLKKTLTANLKFTTDVDSDSFRRKCEQRLFDKQKSCSWRHIEEKAASKTEWNWHHPKALEDLRDRMVRQNFWIQEGDYINISPPPPSSSILWKEETRDPNSGEVILTLTTQNGDRIHYSVDGSTATTNSPVVENARQFRTKALRVSFLCVDSTGKHSSGQAKVWTNRITIKHEYTTMQNGNRGIRLVSAPPANIFVTFDGTSPKSNEAISFKGFPLEIPEKAKIILAVARSEGVESEIEEIRVPTEKGPEIDPSLPATLFHPYEATTTKASFELLEFVQKLGGHLGGIRLSLQRGDHFLELNSADCLKLEAIVLKEMIPLLRNILCDAEIIISYQSVGFPNGLSLTKFASEMQIDLKDKHVKQDKIGKAA